MASFTIRSATPADADFLTDMLVEAVNWEPHRHRPREEIMADPPLVAPITADGRWARLVLLAVLGGGIGLAGAGVLRMRRSLRTVNQSGPAL